MIIPLRLNVVLLTMAVASPTFAAAPATQPDASAYPALQKKLAALAARVKELEVQNMTLAKENESMKTRLGAIDKQAAAAAMVAKGGADERSDAVRIGMSMAAMRAFTKDAGHLDGESESGTSYSFQKVLGGVGHFMVYRCRFDSSGKLVSYAPEEITPDPRF